ncbi:MAG: DnaJ C-terminal domain-containing protein, partial [Myxococcota bacterium]
PTCGGVGEVIQTQMFLRIRTVCPTCRGRGKIIASPCTACNGQGRTRVASKLTVDIPAGVNTGQQLRLSGKGDEGDPGAPPGDLYVLLNVGEHDFFKRDGDDIYCTVPISYAQACLGATITVPTIDEEEQLNIPAGTPSGKVLTLRDKGVPRLRGRGRGAQHVQVVVSVPKKLSAEEEDLIRKLADLQDDKVKENHKGFLSEFWDRLTKKDD